MEKGMMSCCSWSRRFSKAVVVASWAVLTWKHLQGRGLKELPGSGCCAVPPLWYLSIPECCVSPDTALPWDTAAAMLCTLELWERTVPALTAFPVALAVSPHSLGPHLLTRTWDFSGKQGLIAQEINNVGFQIALGWGKQGYGTPNSAANITDTYLWILRAHTAFSMGTDWFPLGWSRDRCQYVINSEQTSRDIRSWWVPPHRDLSVSKTGKNLKWQRWSKCIQGLVLLLTMSITWHKSWNDVAVIRPQMKWGC